MRGFILSDEPIREEAQDELEVLPFVKRLVKPLLEWPEDQSLVLGLFASWGQGKSSVLNLLEEELSRGDGKRVAIVVRFNPWYYGDANTLLYSFFGTLATATGNSNLISWRTRRVLGNALKKLGKVAGLGVALTTTKDAGAVAGAAISAAGELLDQGQQGLEQAKQKAAKFLLKLARMNRPLRVVVLVDDLDRVDDDEVRLMLRVVRLLASLPNVSYVLAMDQARVRQVLSAEYTDKYGASFLEKIVQLPVHLPPIGHSTLEKLVKQAAEEVFTEAGFVGTSVFPQRDESLLEDVYDVTIGSRLRSLRDRARLINALRLMLLTGPERFDVHPHEALLVSFLQTFFPDVYARVSRNKEFLTGAYSDAELARRIWLKEDEDAKLREATLHKIITGVRDPEAKYDRDWLKITGMTEEDVETVRRTLGFLFPFSTKGFRHEEETSSRLRAENRIQSPDRFDRYFRLQPPPGEISDEFIETFLADVIDNFQTADVLERQNLLMAQVANMDDRRRSSFFSKLQDRISLQPAIAAPGLVKFVLAFQGRWPVGEVPRVIHSLVRTLFQSADASVGAASEETAAEMVEWELDALPDLHDVVDVANDYARGKTRDVHFSEELRKKLAKKSLTRVEKGLADNQDLFDAHQTADAMFVVWRWRDLLALVGQSTDIIKTYLSRRLHGDCPTLIKVVRTMSGTGDDGRIRFGAGASVDEMRQAVDSIFGVPALLELCRSCLEEGVDESSTELLKQVLDRFPE